MPLLLDLFSGTGSVSNYARGQLGWEAVTLDRDAPAHLHMDVMDWDYKQLPPKSYDFIWASPPCTEYSCAKTTGKRNLELADSLVQRTLEIIDYFKPPLGYCIENPQTGLLKGRTFMQNRPYTDVDYCKYDMPYRKRTRIWNNIQDKWTPKPLCKRDCDSLIEGTKKHKQIAQRFPHKGQTYDCFNASELGRIPWQLVHDILTAVFPLTPLQVVPVFEM
jgi:hypothetical protein